MAFVNKGDFPRSRLGEKQRGKILAGWVSRKMRTVAQFAIKDQDAAAGTPGTPSGEPGPEAPAGHMSLVAAAETNRASLSSSRSSGAFGSAAATLQGPNSSLRNVEHAPQILEQRELEQQMESMMSSPELAVHPPPRPVMGEMAADEIDHDQTPTKMVQSRYEFPFPAGPTMDPAVSPTQALPQIRLHGMHGREACDDWEQRHASPRGLVHDEPFASAGGGMEDDWTRDAYRSMSLAGSLGKGPG